MCNGDSSGFEAIGKVILYIGLFIGVGAIIVYAPWLILVIIVGVVVWAVASSKSQSGNNSNNSITSDFYVEYKQQSDRTESSFVDDSNLSDFQRKLQENTKTPEQVEDENWIKEKEQITYEANKDYEYIKQRLLNRAKSGQYSTINGYKNISIDYYCDYLLRCVERRYYYRPTEKACYNISKVKQYNFYLDVINKFASTDNISIISFFAETNIIKNSENKISLPYTYTYTYEYGQSVATHKIKAYLKCSIRY